MTNNLANVFDIEPEGCVATMHVEQVVMEDSKVTEDSDFDYARGNCYQLIEQGKAAINTAMTVAAETQNPRALEVLGMLIKNMADVNKQLVQMSKDKQEVKIARKQVGGNVQQITQNSTSTSVITGTLDDVLKSIK